MLQLVPFCHECHGWGICSELMKFYCVVADSVEGSLQFVVIRPLSKVSSWSLPSRMELVGSGVSTHFFRSKGVGTSLGKRMHVLSIGSVFGGVLLPIGVVDSGPFDLEYFIFGSCFLNACPSNLF